MKHIMSICLIALCLSVSTFSFAEISQQQVESLFQKNGIVSTQTLQVTNESIQLGHEHEKSTYGLVFFYMSSCIHCRRFDPILKSEAEKYHITVYPFTLDGGTFPEFPQSEKPSPEVLSHFFDRSKPITVPTVFLINQKTLKAYLVNQGELSASEFEARLQSLIAHIQEKSS